MLCRVLIRHCTMSPLTRMLQIRLRCLNKVHCDCLQIVIEFGLNGRWSCRSCVWVSVSFLERRWRPSMASFGWTFFIPRHPQGTVPWRKHVVEVLYLVLFTTAMLEGLYINGYMDLILVVSYCTTRGLLPWFRYKYNKQLSMLVRCNNIMFTCIVLEYEGGGVTLLIEIALWHAAIISIG